MEIKQNTPIHLCTDRPSVSLFRQGFMPEHISNIVKKETAGPLEFLFVIEGNNKTETIHFDNGTIV